MRTTLMIEDPQGLINTLQTRVTQLEAQVERERARQAHDLPGEVKEVLKSLRRHGVILLHIGAAELKDVRAEVEANPVLREALDQAWPLANAPVSDEVKNAFQVAANNGMDRWF